MRRSLNLALAASLLASCSPEAAEPTSEPVSTELSAASTPASEAKEWPFEQCDRQGNDLALTACMLEDLAQARAELDEVVKQVREATRQEGLDMGARDDPDDPERTLPTAYGLSNFTDSFDQMQAAWETLKERQCDWDTIVAFAGQGSGRHMFYIECETELIKERTEFLRRQLQSDRFAF